MAILVTFLVTFTLTYFYVYETLFYVIEKSRGNDLYVIYPYFTKFQRIFFYISKLTPFAVTIFMNYTIVFLSKDYEKEVDEGSSTDEDDEKTADTLIQ